MSTVWAMNNSNTNQVPTRSLTFKWLKTETYSINPNSSLSTPMASRRQFRKPTYSKMASSREAVLMASRLEETRKILCSWVRGPMYQRRVRSAREGLSPKQLVITNRASMTMEISQTMCFSRIWIESSTFLPTSSRSFRRNRKGKSI